MLVTLLIGLLGAFLNYWFTKWLKGKFGESLPGVGAKPPSVEELRASKPEFMAELQFHESLGPLRRRMAERLFDRACERYAHQDCAPIVTDAVHTADFSKLVPVLTDGLTAED